MMLNTGKDSWVVIFRTLLEREIDINDLDKVRAYKAELAGVLESAYYTCSTSHFDSTNHLKREIGKILSESDLPECLTSLHDPIKLPGKRQPSFLESVSATLERYEVMELVEDTFSHLVNALILGGSMAYGPFFNVRGGLEGGSDLDIIATYDENSFFDEKEWKDFNSSELFDRADVEDFFRRKNIYHRLMKEGRADIFSHRFRVSECSIVVSVHFMVKGYFDDVMCADFCETTNRGRSNLIIAKDFKAEYASGREGPLISLSGEKRHVETVVHSSDGFIVETPLYIIEDNRLYLGLYYRITLPAFRVFGRQGTHAHSIMSKIRDAVSRRIKDERSAYGVASFTLAHPRGPIFPLGKYDEL